MLVSHDYKFIFIKPKKVAGSSIQSYLARYCLNGINYSRDPKSHMSASQVLDKLGMDIWDSYLKITVARNPWDKTVSLYYWRRRKRPLYIHIRRFLKGWPWHSPAMRHDFKSYVKYLYDRNELNADRDIVRINDDLPDYFFIRFESLHDDMEALCSKIGVDYNPQDLPQKKAGHRKSSEYRDHYDEETKELVRRAHEEEIKRFGYNF